MKKKNGFTLIELLAVIVILAVIALIVTPMVMNTINSAREGAAKSSGYELIHAVETRLAVLAMAGKDYTAATGFTVSSGSIMNGAAESADWTSLLNHGNSISGSITVNGVSVVNADLYITNGTQYHFSYDGKSLIKK